MGLQKGDEIITTIMEHHSNIVPWQFLASRGIKLKFIDITDDGLLKIDQLENELNSNTKLVAVTHVSNVLGTINPIEDISSMAHNAGALCLVDAAQGAPKIKIDVKKINCDFLAFTAHKMLGPMGMGVLYGKKELLEKINPFNYGGDMIRTVTKEGSTWNDLPWKFEAGTSNVSGAVGLSTAIDYLKKIGMENVREHDKNMMQYAIDVLSTIKGIKIYGPLTAENRSGALSFNLGDIHPHDLATILNDKGIAIRSGHHCAQPLMERLGVPATSRASFYIYNTLEEIDRLAEGLEHAKNVFKIE